MEQRPSRIERPAKRPVLDSVMTRAAVKVVADDRVAGGREVHPKLMRSAGFCTQRQQRDVGRDPERPVGGA